MLKTHRTSKERTGYILKLRQSRAFKGIALTLALNIIVEMVHPTISLALTEGPSQPEVQSFEPIGTTQMVDLFTGDFNYNIPLFNLPGPNGGYPVNLAYHAGVSMDDEASWVGLGWNINPGALVRNMRGLPDEFLSTPDNLSESKSNSDYLEVKSDMKQSWTLGASFGTSLELLGGNPSNSIDFGLGLSLYYNNYRGVGIGIDPSIQTGHNSPFSIGLSIDSENGLGVNAELSLKENQKHRTNKHKLSVDFNGDIAVGYSLSVEDKSGIHKVKSNGEYSSVKGSNNKYSSSISFSRNISTPSIAQKIDNFNFSGSLSFGATTAPGVYNKNKVSIFYNTQDYKNEDKRGRKMLVAGYDKIGDIVLSEYNKRYTRDFQRQNEGQVTKNSIVLASSYYTYDTYHSTGQGLSGYFRPKRNDIGKSFDPYIRNIGVGGNIAFEVGGGAGGHLGVDGGVNANWDTQGPWDNDLLVYNTNTLSDDFLSTHPAGIDENLYYQAHGEHTVRLDSDLSYLGGLGLATVRLQAKSNDNLSGGKRRIDASSASFDNDGNMNQPRMVRNTLIHTFQNAEVVKLGEFQFKYYTGNANYSFISGNTESLGLFDSPSQPYNRSIRGEQSTDISKHKAGFKVLNEEGSYYVYGLPAYNNKDVENVFSVKEPINGDQANNIEYNLNNSNDEVDYKLENTSGSNLFNSHKYISKKTKSPYAHSFLLTSVQGADYVDILNDGPTDDDLGYWVKFDYVKNSSDYQWRSPYDNQKVKYHRGDSYQWDDDKGSYQYGEKEIWYLGRIETKSHIAIFVAGDRLDNKEANGELLSSTSNNDHGASLKEIRIYDKKSFNSSATPLQTVHFEYTHDLCPGAFNSTQGKLTLKSIYFTSLGSTRGEDSKYEFDYSGLNLNGNNNEGLNPSYSENSFDSWGTYKPLYSLANNPVDHDFFSHFPYTNQFNQDWGENYNYSSSLQNSTSKQETQEMQDKFSSAWCLSRIKLPSGGTIKIDYESDDYGYVQHKSATQMFNIVRIGSESTTSPGELYEENASSNDFQDNTSFDDENRRRIYFKLEDPIKNSVSEEQAALEVKRKYVDPLIQDENGNRNLFFKSKMKLINSSQVDKVVWEYISGYLELESSLTKSSSGLIHYNYGVHTGNLDGQPTSFTESGVTYNTIGYVTICAAKKKNNVDYFDKYHPMSLAAWTYLQTSATELLNNSNSFSSNTVNSDNALGKMVDLVNLVPQLMSSFGGIRKYCQNKQMARYIDLEKSCIRLVSPDKKKYGGGHRVKQISITDNWQISSSEIDRTYGQNYDYTIEEIDPLGAINVISSGVAQYEPQAIGDENALKYPIYFFGKSSIFTRNNLFAEAPLNEDLFPGPTVGYRKVSVRTINTKDQEEKSSLTPNTASGRTGGISEHEFYTAKEFPTLCSNSSLSENANTKDAFNLPVVIPFIGSIKRNYFHGTQSFLIETNDMHGKPKATRTFEMNGYKKTNLPITEQTLEYQSIPITYQGENVMKLDNSVSVIANDATNQMSNQNHSMGVDVDLFTDQRETKNFSGSIGIEFNVDLPSFLAFLPSFWITFTNHKSMFRTFVTNKVVHRSGIVKKSKSRDLQTINETEVLAYDEKSGTPLLTKVKNEFGDDFYSYNIPAYYHYDRMGHAYQNINYTFTVDFPSFSANYPPGSNDEHKLEATLNLPIPNGEDWEQYLVRGDELLISIVESPGNISNQYKKGYYLGVTYGSGGQKYMKLHFPNISSSNAGEYTLKVIRSGRRNHYGTMAANYLTKDILAPSGTNYPYSSSITNESTTLKRADNVLSATASLFKDDWTTTNSENVSFNGTTKNPFLTGNSGIWRPYKSYTYVGERKGTASMSNNSTTDPDLREDGIMNSVPLFSWDIGSMEQFVPNWEWVNEVSRFSQDAYELENVNRLGIYSSALYGYDNSLTIAVGGNASIYELGAYDFEVDNSSPYSAQQFSKRLSQTNMNFDVYDVPGTALISEQYTITKATSLSGNLMEIQTDIPYAYWTSNSTYFEQNIGITLISMESGVSPNNEGYYFNGKRGATAQNVGGFVKFSQAIPYIDDPTELNNMVQVGTKHHGKISLLRLKNFNSSESPGNNLIQAVLSTTKSHTGKQSLKITAESIFEQPKLKTISGKKYVISLWVSRDNTKVRTYEPISSATPLIQVGEIGGTGFSPISGAKYTFSKKIEGWQKIDVEFEATSSNMFLAFKFLKNDTNPLYVDDIRYSPKTGGITTYVYDPNKFWLRASLNVDNYATFFYYDEEGNLTIKKQETEEGIFTITESRGHVKEN